MLHGTYQEIHEQNWHNTEKDDKEDEGEGWVGHPERCRDAVLTTDVLSKHGGKVDLAKHHDKGLDR
jgi:hypothetical protein